MLFSKVEFLLLDVLATLTPTLSFGEREYRKMFFGALVGQTDLAYKEVIIVLLLWGFLASSTANL